MNTKPVVVDTLQWSVAQESERLEDGDIAGEVVLIASKAPDRATVIILTECYYNGRDLVSHRAKSYSCPERARSAYRACRGMLSANVHVLRLTIENSRLRADVLACQVSL